MVEYGPKRVLYIANENAMKGGIGTVVEDLYSGIQKSEDFRLDKLVAVSNHKPSEKEVSGSLISASGTSNFTFNVAGLEKCLGNYDLVHVHGLPSYPILRALSSVKKNKGIKIVNTVHSSVKQDFLAHLEAARREAYSTNKPEAVKRYDNLKKEYDQGILTHPGKFLKDNNYWASAVYMQSRIMSLSDKIQHMTHAYRNDVLNEYKAHCNAHKHIVIPHGVEAVDKVTPMPKKKRLLYVGRFAKEKGFDQFIDSLPQIFENHPEVEVRIAGGPENKTEAYKKRVFRKIRQHFPNDYQKILQKINFVGWLDNKDELRKLYDWTDYVVIPSKAESFCLVAAEAMMHGRIPIITKTHAMDELYVSKGAAFGIDERKRDAKGIAGKVIEVLNKPEAIIDKMSRRARDLAVDKYCLDTMIDRQLATYRKLLGSQSSHERFMKLIENSQPDKTVKGYGTEVCLYSTPGFRHRGVVVKKEMPDKIKKELEAMLKLKEIFNGNNRYKIPELISNDAKTMVVQRLYGQNALEKIIQDPADTKVLEEVVNWLLALHGSGLRDRQYRIGDTPAFKKFEQHLEEDKKKFGEFEEYAKIEQAVKKWSDRKFNSTISFLHGDSSPIHYFFEEDGVYGIDFNASRAGPVEQDISSFISNGMLHFSISLGEEKAKEIISSFIAQYSKKAQLDFKDRLQFFVAYNDYQKARMFEKDVVRDHLQKIVESLNSEQFELK